MKTADHDTAKRPARRTDAHRSRSVRATACRTSRRSLPLATKRELIERLARAGLREIEAGAFVSPKRIPQMADSAQLLHLLRSRIATLGRRAPAGADAQSAGVHGRRRGRCGPRGGVRGGLGDVLAAQHQLLDRRIAAALRAGAGGGAGGPYPRARLPVVRHRLSVQFHH